MECLLTLNFLVDVTFPVRLRLFQVEVNVKNWWPLVCRRLKGVFAAAIRSSPAIRTCFSTAHKWSGLWVRHARALLAGVVVSVVFTVAAPAGAATVRFDFGPVGSPVWPGCVGVTPELCYSAGAGFGWVAPRGLVGVQRTIGQGQARVWAPDRLWGDFIFSEQQSLFRADLSNGVYEVVLLIGDIGTYAGRHGSRLRGVYPCSTLAVKANGVTRIREVIDEHNIADYWYRNEMTEYHPGDSLWETCVETKLYPRTFPVAVTGGTLALEFSPDCRVAGLFVYPVGEKELFQQWWQEQRAKRREAFMGRYELQPFTPVSPMLQPTEEDISRGYVLFSRSYQDEVSIDSRPAPDERSTDFSLFAARGEAETVTFSVVPLADLKDVRVTPGDLTGLAGARIPAACWEVRLARYMLAPTDHEVRARLNGYRVEGRLLDLFAPRDFDTGSTRRFWLTIAVPHDTTPGVYRGAFRFQAAGRPEAMLPVTIRVLPFELATPRDVSLGMFFSPASPWQYVPGKADLYWKDVKRALECMREYGFTSASCSVDRPRFVFNRNGCPQADFSRFDRFFRLFREAGFNTSSPFLLYGNDGGSARTGMRPNSQMGRIEANCDRNDVYLNAPWAERFRTMLRLQVRHGKKRAWPPIVFCVHDEVHGWSREKLDGMAEILAATYMQEPEVITAGCINTPEGTGLVPYHDYPMYNPDVPITPETLELVRTHGKQLALDNVGCNRWCNGFWLWHTQPALVANSFFCWTSADPYNPFDSVDGAELAVAYPGRDTWVPTPALVRMREGIDDYCYARTLQDALAAAHAKGVDPETLQQGAETLRFLDGLVDVRLKKYVHEGMPSVEACNRMRYRIARDIAALQGTILPEYPPEAQTVDEWWPADWAFRVPLDVDAGLYTRRDDLVVAQIDLADLAAKAGIQAVDKNSLRLVAAGGKPHMVPFRFAEGRLAWKVSGRHEALTTRRYYLYFDASGTGCSARAQEYRLELQEPLPTTNLIRNPGFEEEAPRGGVAHWNLPRPSQLSPEHRVEADSSEQVSGKRSLKCVQIEGRLDRTAHARALQKGIPVIPGRRYMLSGSIKRAGGDSQTVIMLWWRGEGNKSIGNRKFPASGKMRHDWKHVSAAATAPPQARCAEIQVFMYPADAQGTAFFDDLSLNLLPESGNPPAAVTAGAVERRDEASVNTASTRFPKKLKLLTHTSEEV